MIKGDLSRKEIHAYIDRLRSGLRGSIEMSGRQFPVTASFGIATFPNDTKNCIDLLKYADTAMYAIKAQGKDGIAFFSEENGYIISIGKWILEQACKRFMEMVTETIEKTGIDPSWLEFEITESIFISSKEYIVKLLNELRQMGIHIALDDFGTQYASLSYIQMLPLDVLKIDKSFVDVICTKDQKMNLVTAIIDIAQQLNYKVIAEGVEKEEQLKYLEANSCDYIQGYLWGKPMKEEAVQQLLMYDKVN